VIGSTRNFGASGASGASIVFADCTGAQEPPLR
jgi:hypothetical protein